MAIAFLDLHDEAVHLPTSAEKEAVKAFSYQQSECEEWRNGFMAVDGTPIVLYQKLGFFGETWFNKDKDYAMALQASSDLNKTNHTTHHDWVCFIDCSPCP